MSNKILTSEEELSRLSALSQAKNLDFADIDEILRQVPALCATVRQLLEETQRLKDELQCEFCDVPVYDEQDNALTFLVCGRCWNKSQEQLRQTIDGLRNEVTEAQKAAEKWYHERY